MFSPKYFPTAYFATNFFGVGAASSREDLLTGNVKIIQSLSGAVKVVLATAGEVKLVQTLEGEVII